MGDYEKVRDLIEATYPDKFKDFNARKFTPRGVSRAIKRASESGRPKAAR
ncbi:hypothetical protein [Sphingomonas oryzagri]